MFSFSTDVAVSPRSLNFDEMKTIKMNESMIIILSYAVALTAVYLFGIFFAQVCFVPIRTYTENIHQSDSILEIRSI